jgi:hypothetical protein
MATNWIQLTLVRENRAGTMPQKAMNVKTWVNLDSVRFMLSDSSGTLLFLDPDWSITVMETTDQIAKSASGI